MLAVSGSTIEAVVSGATFLLGFVLLAGLFRSRRGLRETTLGSSWFWSLTAAAALVASQAAVSIWRGDSHSLPGWLIATRFAAFAATFCPTMALMGAKRPQSSEWNFVVLSLWGILALPAGWSALVRPGRFTLEPIWAVFLLALILIGIFNFVFTRYWVSSLLYGTGQMSLVVNDLPWIANRSASSVGQSNHVLLAPLVAMAAFAAALAAAHWVARRATSGRQHIQPLNRLWFDFRDTFGAVWALRVAQRTNAAAAMYNWNIVLRWDGLHVCPQHDAAPRRDSDSQHDSDLLNDSLAASGCAAISQENARAIEHNLRGLLRRFVSQKWIDDRLRP